MSATPQMIALRRVASTADKLLNLARSVSMDEFGWMAWELLAELKERLADLRYVEEGETE